MALSVLCAVSAALPHCAQTSAVAAPLCVSADSLLTQPFTCVASFLSLLNPHLPVSAFLSQPLRLLAMGLEDETGSNPTWIVLSVVSLLLAALGGFIYYADQQRKALKGDQQQDDTVSQPTYPAYSLQPAPLLLLIDCAHCVSSVEAEANVKEEAGKRSAFQPCTVCKSATHSLTARLQSPFIVSL